VGRGAERLAILYSQGSHHRSLFGSSVRQGWAEENACFVACPEMGYETDERDKLWSVECEWVEKFYTQEWGGVRSEKR